MNQHVWIAALLLSAGWTAAATAGDVPEAGAIFEQAKDMAGRGEHAAALDKFEAAIRRQPNRLHWGADYRQAVIEVEAYDRCIAFFEGLLEEHPQAPNLYMNYGMAHVDKIPAEGSITQVILANTALTQFSKALELESTWLGHYTRGNSYMYWPAIFGRTKLGIEDLERAIEIAGTTDLKPFQARAWAALGDGYWRLDDLAKATEVWRRGLELYPGTPELEGRLARQGEALDTYLEVNYETARRVETHLRELRESL